MSLATLGCEDSKPNIVPLKQFDSEGKIIIKDYVSLDKDENFIIQNYKDLEDIEAKVDSIALSKWDSTIAKYDNYSIVFFKESDETNIEALRDNPRNMYRYSQERDMIYWFRWSKGKFMGKMKFVDGKEIKGDERKFKNGSIK